MIPPETPEEAAFRLLEIDATSARSSRGRIEPRWSLLRFSARDRLARSAGALSAAARTLDGRAERGGAELDLRRGVYRLRLGLPDAAVAPLERAALSRKPRPEILYRLGTAYAGSSRFVQAAECFERVVAVDPSHRDARLWLGESLLRSGRGREGRRQLRRSAREHPESWLAPLLLGRAGDADALDEAVVLSERKPCVLFVRGWLLLRRGRADAAFRDLSAAVAAEPEAKWGRLLLAKAALVRGDEAAGRKNFEGALSLDPDVTSSCHPWQSGDPRPADVAFLDRMIARFPRAAWLRAWRGEIFYDLLRPADALADLEAASRKSSGRPWIQAFLSRARVRWGKDVRGAAALMSEAAAGGGRFPWIGAWHGQIIDRDGHGERASGFYDAAISRAPAYALPYHWRGKHRLSKGDNRGALSDFDRAVELDPRYGPNLERRRWARWLLGDARGAFEDMACAVRRENRFSWAAGSGEQYEARVSELTRLLKRGGGAWPLAWRGETHLRFHRLAAAVSDLSRAVRRDSSCAWTWAWRGEAFRRLGRYREAAEDFDEAVRRDPEYSLAYGWRAATLAAQGRLAAAKRDLDRALRLDFGCAWAYDLRGRIHLAGKRKRLGLFDLERAAALDPGFAQPRRILERARAAPARMP